MPELANCDLVLRGGGLSWLAHPYAAVEIARTHRIRSVGGASSGGTAAAFIAAAELARDHGGFERLAAIPSDFVLRLATIHQPQPRLRPAYQLMTAMLGDKPLATRVSRIARALLPLGLWHIVGLAPGLALGALALGTGQWLALPLLVPLTLACWAGVVFQRLQKRFSEVWVPSGHGFVPGIAQGGSQEPGLIDWIATQLDQVAGVDSPLTFGHLSNHEPPIRLAMNGADATTGSPLRTPEDLTELLWREEALRTVLPGPVVDHICAVADRVEGGLLRLSRVDDIPVALAVRISIALPAFMTGVSAMRVDAMGDLRPVLLMDGGIYSNFPVHFFDSPWPRWPTFGFSFESPHPDEPDRDIVVPDSPDSPQRQFRIVLDSLGAYAGAMYYTMRDWSDVLTSSSPGYRERIAIMRLQGAENGWDDQPPPEQVLRMAERGRKAARQLLDTFDWNAHRWTRHLATMRTLEAFLRSADRSWSSAQPTLGDFVQTYGRDPAAWPRDEAWLDASRADLEALQQLASEWMQRHPQPEQRPPGARFVLRPVHRV